MQQLTPQVGGAAHLDYNRNISFDELIPYFKLPISEAVEKLNINPATLKRVCRENGIPRWPSRKIQAGKSLEQIRREGRSQMEMLRLKNRDWSSPGGSASKVHVPPAPLLSSPVTPSLPPSISFAPGVTQSEPRAPLEYPTHPPLRRARLPETPWVPPTGSVDLGPGLPRPWWGTKPEEDIPDDGNEEIQHEEDITGLRAGVATEGTELKEDDGELRFGDGVAIEGLKSRLVGVGREEGGALVGEIVRKRQKVVDLGKVYSRPAAYGWSLTGEKEKLSLEFAFGRFLPTSWSLP